MGRFLSYPREQSLSSVNSATPTLWLPRLTFTTGRAFLQLTRAALFTGSMIQGHAWGRLNGGQTDLPGLWETFYLEEIISGTQEGEAQRDSGDIPVSTLRQELLSEVQLEGSHGLDPFRQKVSLLILRANFHQSKLYESAR